MTANEATVLRRLRVYRLGQCPKNLTLARLEELRFLTH